MEPISMHPHSHPTSSVETTQLKDIRKRLPLRALTPDDWSHWTTNGYVVVKQAVPADKVARLVALLWAFDEKDPDDTATWETPQRRAHAMPELNHTGMLEIYNHQYLWDTRTDPRVYDAFVDIWDREDLWVTIDRANLNLPRRTGPRAGGFIHWDVDSSMRPLPIGVQGVLSLAKQDRDVGGFQCVPSLFRDFETWVQTQPPDRDPMHPDVSGLEIEHVDLDAGDLLIFNSLLAHGVRPNLSADRPRIAQYVAMQPAEWDDAPQREERIRLWRERDHPQRPAFPGDPRAWEKEHAAVATLTPLGERLLGLTRW